MPGKARRIAGTVLIILGSAALLGSASAKFAHVPAVVAQMSASGLAGWRLTFVAALEVFSTILFLVPATRSAGLLFVSAFLGGAIATHLQHGQSIVPPAVVLTLIWLGAWLRHPVILWSFGASTANGHQPPAGQRP